MTVFTSILNQLAILFGFIIIGYVLVKCKAVPENSASVLSKLENTVFIPGLVMGTFIENFTADRLGEARELLIMSFVIAIIVIPVAILFAKITSKDKYIQKIYTYGLSFSNFGFMGNAVVAGIFPDIFFEYLIFTLPLWILIYVWGVPGLLISDADAKQTLKQKLKAFINPMFVAMLVGMLIGIARIPVPGWAVSIIDVAGDCMSPVAMILTGIVVASNSMKKAVSNVSIYIVSLIRLVVMPLLFIFVASFFKMSETVYICAVCSLSMPLGLNTIVIPSAYNKDTSVAAGMTVISHLLSLATIPLIFGLAIA